MKDRRSSCAVLRLGLEVCDVGLDFLDFGLNPSKEHTVVYIETHLYRPGPPARTEAGGACGRAGVRQRHGVRRTPLRKGTAGIIAFAYLVLRRAIWTVGILWDFG